jgi:hypothetical protein
MPRSTARAKIFNALMDPLGRHIALAVRTPVITGRARRTRAESAQNAPTKGSGSEQLRKHPENEATAPNPLQAAGTATKAKTPRPTRVP